MTDYAKGFKDFVAWHDGVTVSDLPISDEDACRLLNVILSMATFTGGFFAVGNGKREFYFSVALPGMLTSVIGETEIMLKLNLDELEHAAELATERMSP